MQEHCFAEITAYEGDQIAARARRSAVAGRALVRVSGADWQIELEDTSASAGEYRRAVVFWHCSGAPVAAAGGLVWEFSDWSQEVYVLLPAGTYAGNRFPALQVPYSPRVPADLVAGIHTPPLITDVPRLNHGEGPSRLQLKTGDLAFPGFGWFDPRQRRAWFVTAANPIALADAVWEVEESADRTRAVFRVSVPGVRQSPVYRLPWMKAPSPDRARPVTAGESLVMELCIEQWDCADMAAFFDRVFVRRAAITDGHEVAPVLPFSAAYDFIEEHYHRDCWREGLGLFASDCNPGSNYVFQTGWCGGMIATLPLMASRNALTAERVRRNLETFFSQAPRPCGLFYGKRRPDGVWTADFSHDTARPYTHTWTLTRRQADALFYLERQLAWLRLSDPAFAIPVHWTQALDRAAQLFVRLWNTHGQFGQFLHQDTGEILVGGSTSGALVPAALVWSWRRTGDPELLRVAREAGEFFAREFLARGVTTGGPGDALQNPDSESSAALVESYAWLHAATGEGRWLERGRAAAALFATWVMPWNFPFPPGTEFHRLSIRTRGAVFANTQNKHAAPGICTHAGAGLLHLFRASGDVRLMDLLRDIARFIPQTVSHADRPIHDPKGRALPSGWINERVNTSDWDENVGGVFYGSCWCEVSMLLTAVELPGVYVRPDLDRVWCLDHVEAELRGNTLRLRNPTAYPARVKVLCETAARAQRPLPPFWFGDALVVELPPRAERSISADDAQLNFAPA